MRALIATSFSSDLYLILGDGTVERYSNQRELVDFILPYDKYVQPIEIINADIVNGQIRFKDWLIHGKQASEQVEAWSLKAKILDLDFDVIQADKGQYLLKLYNRDRLSSILSIPDWALSVKLVGVSNTIESLRLGKYTASFFGELGENIQNIHFGPSLYRLSVDMMKNAKKLNEIKLGSGVSIIDKMSLVDCNDLKLLDLSDCNNLNYIPRLTNHNIDSKLETLMIPPNIRDIENLAFGKLTNIKSLYLTRNQLGSPSKFRKTEGNNMLVDITDLSDWAIELLNNIGNNALVRIKTGDCKLIIH